jgi:hypothetical protein
MENGRLESCGSEFGLVGHSCEHSNEPVLGKRWEIP